jgi:hypothetical protein
VSGPPALLKLKYYAMPVDTAQEKQLLLFVTYPSDLSQFEISHLYDTVYKTFTLILHMSVVSSSNVLGLHKFLPLPIHFDSTSKKSVTLDVGQTNLLAIRHTQIIINYLQVGPPLLLTRLHLRDTFFGKARTKQSDIDRLS